MYIVNGVDVIPRRFEVEAESQGSPRIICVIAQGRNKLSLGLQVE
jgi:hypothetical protein